MNEDSDYTWYIDTRGNAVANRMIAEALEEGCYENECRDMRCEGGTTLSLWECPCYAFLARFEESAKSLQLPYDVYLRKGRYGLVRLWHFSKASVTIRAHRRNRKTATIAERAKEQPVSA